MEFTDVLKYRKSVRKFTDEKLSQEELRQLVSAANQAPVGSACYNDVHLTVVQDQNILEKLSEASVKRAENRALMQQIAGKISQMPPAGKKFNPFYNAPAVIFISHRKQTLQPGIEYANAACVAQTIHLAAVNLGLGSVLIWGVLEAMREIPELDHTDLLQLPPDFVPLMGVAVGHSSAVPAERPLKTDRLSVNYLP